MDDHALVVYIPLQGTPGDVIDLQDLGDRLAERVEAASVGEFDGDMIGKDLAVLYLYGSDADRLWHSIEDVLRVASLPDGAHVIKRYGPPGSPETRSDL